MRFHCQYHLSKVAWLCSKILTSRDKFSKHFQTKNILSNFTWWKCGFGSANNSLIRPDWDTVHSGSHGKKFQCGTTVQETVYKSLGRASFLTNPYKFFCSTLGMQHRDSVGLKKIKHRTLCHASKRWHGTYRVPYWGYQIPILLILYIY